MKIKNYKCKCGSDEFFFIDKKKGEEMITGIYCMKCGMWLKWTDKNERNLVYLYKEMNK